MTFHFAPAIRQEVSLLIALAGASGSGKTFSALRLAKGMAPTGKIAFLDTEARRGLHYADQFQFMHADMRPPFRPAAFIEGIKAAEAAGAEVVIIDSFSHEYDGEGGILDWADEVERGGTKSPGNWKVPKGAHKKLMNSLLQCRASIIFCLRADEKIRIGKDPNTGKTVVEPLGWVPICEKRFMYEMTASFTLTPDRPGIPQFGLPHKLQSQHRSMFSDGEPISETSGRALAEWSKGGAPSKQPAEPKRAAAPDEPAEQPPRTSSVSFTPQEYIDSWDALLRDTKTPEEKATAGVRWNSETEKQWRRETFEDRDDARLAALITRVRDKLAKAPTQ